MAALILLLLIATVLDAGRKPLSRELEFDVIELNHRHDENWNHCYDQLILWRWSPDYRRYDVEAWMLLRDKDLVFRKVGERWVVSQVQGGDLVSIKSRVKIETWTNYDPERKNKSLKEERYRRGLR